VCRDITARIAQHTDNTLTSSDRRATAQSSRTHSRLFDTLKWRGQAASAARRATSGEQRHSANRHDEHIAKPDAHRRAGNETPPTARIATGENLHIVEGVDFLANDLDVTRRSLPSHDVTIRRSIDAGYNLQKYRFDLSNP